MAEPEIEKAKEKVRRGRKFRFVVTCIAILIACVIFSGIIVTILWYTNFISKNVCTNFTPGSNPYNTFQCATRAEAPAVVSNPGDKFEIKEGNEEKTVQITEEEAIVSKVFEKASPAVVGIGVTSAEGEQVIGSGFFVSQNGLIITNQHVVSNTAQTYFITIRDTDQKIEVKAIHRDVLNDIALIEVEGSNYPYLALGDSDKLKPGQSVVAIGNPLGKLENTVTSGIISGLHRDVSVGDQLSFGKSEYQDVIQTDAAINPGNSGGPLLNSSGEVIGINFATVSGANNLSFALPINRIKSRIDELNKFGKLRIPFLGIEYNSRITFVKDQVTLGAVIASIEPGSPAEKAGLKKGDIIIGFNGTSLDDKPLQILIQESEVGKPVKLSLLRDGELMELEVTVGERSE